MKLNSNFAAKHEAKSLIWPLTIARMIGVSIVYSGHFGLISDSYFKGTRKISGWFWFFPLQSVDGGTLVVFFFCLTSYLLTYRFFVSRSKYWLLWGCLKRWPQLAIPTTLSLYLAWILHRLSLYHCSHYFPPNSTIFDVTVAGVLAPLFASKAAAYVFPTWFITGIFYMSHIAVLLALLFTYVLKENIRLTITMLVILYFGLNFVPQDANSAVQSLHIPEMVIASISVITGVLLAWYHAVKQPKIYSVYRASLLLSVSLISLFFLFFVQIYRETTGHQNLQIPYQLKIYIQTFGTAGIIHSTVCNKEMTFASKHKCTGVSWFNSMSLIVFFIHSQVLQTIGCYLLETYLNPSQSYWVLLLIFHIVSVVLLLSAVVIYFVGAQVVKIVSWTKLQVVSAMKT